MDVLARKEGTSDYQSMGSCKIYASLAVAVCLGVQTILSDHRFIHVFPSDLSVHIPDDDLDVSTRTAVIHVLQLRVEGFLLDVGSSFVWAVHINDAVVVEPAFNSQHAHPVVDRLPLDHTTLHLTQHNKAGTQLVGCATTLIILGPAATHPSYILSFSAKFLQRYDTEATGFKLIQ